MKKRVKKTLVAALTVLVCVFAVFGFAACGDSKQPAGGGSGNGNDNTEIVKTLASVSFLYGTQKEYIVGEEVTEDKNSIVLSYNTKETETVAVTAEGVTVTGDTSEAGDKKGKITYGGVEGEFAYTVYEPLDASVTVTGGDVKGYKTADGKINIYKGIPYAAAPTGELRWRAPQDVEDWEGVLECYHFGSSAMQTLTNTGDYGIVAQAGMSEDCLTLNVWAPKDANGNNPVIVYIHGGDNNDGGSSAAVYDGEALARQGAVFVSINYRLGIFGYLAAEELSGQEDGETNFGLLDQIKALNWIQDNISEFGGNKDNVTVVGHGMGGMSIEAMMCSPLAEGLFNNAAILSSGMYFLQDLPALEDSYLNLGDKTISDLREADAAEVMKLESKVYLPVFDNYVLTNATMRGALANNAGNSGNVNVLLGVNSKDSSYYKTMYSTPSATGPHALVSLMLGQRNMFINARLLGGAVGANYLYYMDYTISASKSGDRCEDVTFWLGNSTMQYGAWSDTDALASEVLSSYLYNFALGGNPNGNNLYSGDELSEWQRSNGDYVYMYMQGATYEQNSMMGPEVSDFESTYSKYSDYSTYFPA